MININIHLETVILESLMALEKLRLKWIYFSQNVTSSFQELREDLDFSDVTLACGDIDIEVHKVVLASGSNFFRDILKKHKHSHPLIYLRGVKSNYMKALVTFLYDGEVSILEQDLDNFLLLAQELKVKGLEEQITTDQIIKEPLQISNQQQINMVFSQNNTDKNNDDHWHENIDTGKEYKDTIYREGVTDSKTYLNKNEESNKNQEGKGSDVLFDGILENHATTLNSMCEKINGIWTCTICGKTTNHNNKGHLRDHVGVHVKDLAFPCKNCGDIFRSTSGLRKHFYRLHFKHD